MTYLNDPWGCQLFSRIMLIAAPAQCRLLLKCLRVGEWVKYLFKLLSCSNHTQEVWTLTSQHSSVMHIFHCNPLTEKLEVLARSWVIHLRLNMCFCVLIMCSDNHLTAQRNNDNNIIHKAKRDYELLLGHNVLVHLRHQLLSELCHSVFLSPQVNYLFLQKLLFQTNYFRSRCWFFTLVYSTGLTYYFKIYMCLS